MKLIYVIEDKIRLLEYWEERSQDSKGLFSIMPFSDINVFFDYASENHIDGCCIVVDRFMPGIDNQKGFVELLNEDTDFKGIKILTSALFKNGKCPKVPGYDYVLSKKDLVDKVLEILNVK